MPTTTQYGIQTTIDATFEDAISQVTDALKGEGFGILTEINMKATLKKKLDVDIENYTILGACNPPLAHQALQNEQEIGLLLPCNVLVYSDSDGQTHVSVLDPAMMVQMTDNPALQAVADEARARLLRVIETL